MRTTHTIKEIAQQSTDWRMKKLRVGFVPTMGNLHEGHMDLFRSIAPHCDRIVCSIFANPLQFGENEDYSSYPRTLEDDIAMLKEVGADCLFAPSVAEMYGDKGMSETKVSVKRLNSRYCGAFREGHFVGVATVVCKLFNIVMPHAAVFGEKDFQQLAVIKRMTSDLSLPVKIISSPTYREQSGLAYSSRNQYLTADERLVAPKLYQTLQQAKTQIEAGSRNWAELGVDAMSSLSAVGFEPEYFEVADALTLDLVSSESTKLVILAAARLGKARLIDNLQVELLAS